MRCLVSSPLSRRSKKPLILNVSFPENVFKKDKCVFPHNMISMSLAFIPFTCRIYFNIFLCRFCMSDSRNTENAHMAANRRKEEEKSHSFHVNSFNFYPYFYCYYAVLQYTGSPFHFENSFLPIARVARVCNGFLR